MYKELRFDKQILEELFDAKFLSASFHMKFINYCCYIIDSRGVENIIKSGTNVSELVQKYFTLIIKIFPIFGSNIHIFES